MADHRRERGLLVLIGKARKKDQIQKDAKPVGGRGFKTGARAAGEGEVPKTHKPGREKEDEATGKDGNGRVV